MSPPAASLPATPVRQSQPLAIVTTGSGYYCWKCGYVKITLEHNRFFFFGSSFVGQKFGNGPVGQLPLEVSHAVAIMCWLGCSHQEAQLGWTSKLVHQVRLVGSVDDPLGSAGADD